jgi:hypothetical protein
MAQGVNPEFKPQHLKEEKRGAGLGMMQGHLGHVWSLQGEVFSVSGLCEPGAPETEATGTSVWSHWLPRVGCLFGVDGT